MSFWLVLPLAFLPSLVWLSFYLRQDAHPEPNEVIVRVFVWSFIVTLVVAFFLYFIDSDFISLDWLITYWDQLKTFPGARLLIQAGFLIFVAALFEELLKYLVVRETVLGKEVFDEPVDAMEYMVISALGFAAMENALVLTQYSKIKDIVAILITRFLGATLIHTVASGVVGFFLAYEIFKSTGAKRPEEKPRFLIAGLLIGSGLHAVYNWLIIESSNLRELKYVAILLGFLLACLVLVVYLFDKLNKENIKQTE